MSDILNTLVITLIGWAGGFFVGWLAHQMKSDKERWAADDAEWEELDQQLMGHRFDEWPEER